MLKSILFTLLASVQAVYLSTLVGPIQTMPGPPTMAVSQMTTLDLDTMNVTTSFGYVGDPTSNPSQCQISNLMAEAPITTGQVDTNLYTVCSTTSADGLPMKTLAAGSLLGGRSYQVLGSTAAFESAVIQRLATDNGTNFYLLTRAEPGNSTIWWIRTGGDLTVIQNGTEDGWVVQHIQITQGSLMGIANRFGNPTAKSVVWWGGRGLPVSPQPPQPYPGLFASNGNNLLGFTFSDPNTIWLVSGAAAAGGSPMLMMYIYNKQTLAWTIGGYYMFNATQPAPSVITMGGRPPITKFHGVTVNALVEYTIPPAGGGGGSGTVSSTLGARILLNADRASTFRGLAVSQWTPIPTPSASTTMSATASASATATATATVTASSSATTTSTATPTSTSTATSTRSAVFYATSFPTFSALVSPSAAPSSTSLASQSSTESMTSTPTRTPTPTSSISTGASPSVTPSAEPTPSTSPSPTMTVTPSSTPSFVNNTNAAAAISTGPDNEGLKLGFGIAVPLLIVGASGFALFTLFKSGKLMTMFKSTPKYFKHGYGKQTYNSARAPRVPMQNHPVLRQNPLNPTSTQMSYNTKILDQMRSQKASMRQLVENQSVMMENGARTIIKTRVSFGPSLSTATLPVSPTVGTSV